MNNYLQEAMSLERMFQRKAPTYRGDQSMIRANFYNELENFLSHYCCVTNNETDILDAYSDFNGKRLDEILDSEKLYKKYKLLVKEIQELN